MKHHEPAIWKAKIDISCLEKAKIVCMIDDPQKKWSSGSLVVRNVVASFGIFYPCSKCEEDD